MKRKLINSVCMAITATALISAPASAKSWVDNNSAKTRVAAKVIKDDMVGSNRQVLPGYGQNQRQNQCHAL